VWLNKAIMLRSSAAAGVSMCVGDYICQRLSTTDGKVDTSRWLIMTATGLAVVGPVNYGFFRTAEIIAPGTSWPSLAKKVAFDLAAAPFRISCTFASVKLLSGAGFSGVQRKLKDDLVPTYLTGAMIFPPVILVMFKFVSEDHRAPIWAVIGSCWCVSCVYSLCSSLCVILLQHSTHCLCLCRNVYLSWMAHKTSNKDKEKVIP
jgi:hypothetical protein